MMFRSGKARPSEFHTAGKDVDEVLSLIVTMILELIGLIIVWWNGLWPNRKAAVMEKRTVQTRAVPSV